MERFVLLTLAALGVAACSGPSRPSSNICADVDTRETIKDRRAVMSTETAGGSVAVGDFGRAIGADELLQFGRPIGAVGVRAREISQQRQYVRRWRAHCSDSQRTARRTEAKRPENHPVRPNRRSPRR